MKCGFSLADRSTLLPIHMELGLVWGFEPLSHFTTKPEIQAAKAGESMTGGELEGFHPFFLPKLTP